VSFFYPQAAMVLRVVWEDFKFQSDPKKQKEYRIKVRAKRVAVSINDYSTADTFSADLDYKSFPFDPRCIRSLGVSIHFEDMKKLCDNGGVPSKIVPSDGNTVFLGFADEESIKLDENSRTVSFEGRDYTALLIDAKYDKGTLDLSRPLKSILEELLSGLKTIGDITIDNRTGAELPILGKFAPDFNELGAHKNSHKHDTYWDVIQDLIRRAGLIAFIELDKLVISKPQNLYDGLKQYQFLYGKNIKELEFKRKLGRQKGFNVSLRSLNIEKKEVLEAKIPLEATDEWLKAIGLPKDEVKIEKLNAKGEVKKDIAPYIGFLITNIVSKEQLIKVGEKTFEEIWRQQIEGSFSTKEMVIAVGSRGVEYDVTKIRNGTPINIEIDQRDMKSFSRHTTVDARIKFLKDNGYEPSVAEALANSAGKFSTTFYTKAVEFTMSEDEGFSMKVGFLNFINLGEKKKGG
jgi:hypothetical protein